MYEEYAFVASEDSWLRILASVGSISATLMYLPVMICWQRFAESEEG